MGFYYLNSRYYDPNTGRFLSVDAFISTGQGLLGYNPYAYCRNEPVFRKDTLGMSDVCVENADEDDNPLNDLGGKVNGNGGGGNGGKVNGNGGKVNGNGGGGNTSSSRGVGGKGWVGDKTWRENVSTVGKGGTVTSLNGGVPTQEQAKQLIDESGGRDIRIDVPHQLPNPHNYPHINYLTKSGIKGTIRILK